MRHRRKLLIPNDLLRLCFSMQRLGPLLTTAAVDVSKGHAVVKFTLKILFQMNPAISVDGVNTGFRTLDTYKNLLTHFTIDLNLIDIPAI